MSAHNLSTQMVSYCATAFCKMFEQKDVDNWFSYRNVRSILLKVQNASENGNKNE